MRILRDIVVIVVVNEIVVADAAIGNDGYHSKDDANGGYLPGLIGCEGFGNGLRGWCLWRVLDRGFALAQFLGHGLQSAII